jgi:hypothetical protein
MVADFRRAFDGPALFWDPEREERIVTATHVVGSLELPTGRLAIHDPGYEFAPDPLDRDVPPGPHSVDLALRSWRNQDGGVSPPGLIAAVRVALRPGRAEHFVPVRSALRERDLDIGVDSGLVAIFDRELLPALGGAALLDVIPESTPASNSAGTAAEIVLAPVGAVFVCMAGMGDGSYRAWWGENADGETVELIVDLGLLEHSLWRTVERPAATLLASAARIRLAFAGTGLELEPVPVDSIGAPVQWAPAETQIAFRRPAGPLWEFRLHDAEGNLIGSPGHVQLVPGPWFEVFDRAQLERAETVRVRIHEGNAPDEPLET